MLNIVPDNAKLYIPVAIRSFLLMLLVNIKKPRMVKQAYINRPNRERGIPQTRAYGLVSTRSQLDANKHTEFMLR